jgi:glycosyltransferase involved in cell wall biosynthesis
MCSLPTCRGGGPFAVEAARLCPPFRRLPTQLPVVTKRGTLREPVWAASTGVAVVPGPDPAALTASAVEVLTLPSESRLALGTRGAELYHSQFSVERTIARLREPGPKPARKRPATFPKIATVFRKR